MKIQFINYSLKMLSFNKIKTILLTFAVFSFVKNTSFSQNLINCSIDSKKYLLEERNINGVTKYFDYAGKEVNPNPVYHLSLSERVKRGYTSVPSISTNKTSVRPTYTVTYLDVVQNTDIGFDDPNLGSTRRTTLESALASILLMFTNTGIIDLEVQVSENQGKGALASAGPLFSASSGFTSGAPNRHITTGKDPFTGFPDAQATFDFGYKYNSTLNDPASDEYDLFSVSLHELTHAMGFTSLIGSDGQSVTSTNTFMYYDQYILNQNNTILLGGEPPALQTTTTDLTSNALNFELITSMISPIYSPTTFSSGSSLSHFDNNRISGVTYVMHPSISSGKKVRELHPDEINVFPKLGYTVESSYIYTSIDNPEVNSTSEFKIYPNPAFDHINAFWNNQETNNFSIKITNIIGNEIIKTSSQDQQLPTSGKTRLDISSLSPGAYFIYIENNGSSKNIKKFIKK